MSPQQEAAFEGLVGDLLQELGYAPVSETERKMSLRTSRLRTTYLAMFEAKHVMKATRLGGLVGLDPLELEPNRAD